MVKAEQRAFCKHMGNRFKWLALCVIGGLLVACNQPFDPKGDLDQKPVVFAVLSTDRNVQFVRVERSYMPGEYDAVIDTSDKAVQYAIVTLSDGTQTMHLRDTTLERSDTSRFKGPIRGYVIGAFRPSYGSSYSVRVEAGGLGTASESILMPTKPIVALDISSVALINFPEERQKDAGILFPISLGNGAYGFVGRMFVDYEVVKDGEWISERVEIPAGFASSNSTDIQYVTYPRLQHKTFNNHAVGIHLNGVYWRTLVNVAYSRYGSTKIVFNRVVYQLLQVDQNLYSYYMTTHSYSDPHSARLDEPLFSGITGGVGMVGAYTLDSLVHIMPENFPFDRY
jgi:hypothetical protein